MELKQTYKYRLMVDESLSFGTLGPRGLGIGDHFGIPNAEIDVIVAAMSNALGSAGGFCTGSLGVVDHQRLSSQAYCFSASLPALLTAAAHAAIDYLLEHPERVRALQRNCETVRRSLEGLVKFRTKSAPNSPLILLEHVGGDRHVLQAAVSRLRRRGILVSRARYSQDEREMPAPAIRICPSAIFTDSECEQLVAAIQDCDRQL